VERTASVNIVWIYQMSSLQRVSDDLNGGSTAKQGKEIAEDINDVNGMLNSCYPIRAEMVFRV
jgi:hypothetical protein